MTLYNIKENIKKNIHQRKNESIKVYLKDFHIKTIPEDELILKKIINRNWFNYNEKEKYISINYNVNLFKRLI